MSTDVRHVGEFPFSVEDYIALFFGDDHVARVLETGVFQVYTVDKLMRGERWTRRELTMSPKHKMPVWVRRVIGDRDVVLVEHADHLQDGEVIELEWVPNVFKSQIQARGRIRLQPTASGGCRSELEMRVDVAMFGFGKRMEPRFAEAIERTYAHRETLMREMVAEPGELKSS